VELHLPHDFLVVLIARGSEYLVPSGGTKLAAGDTLLVLSEQEAFERVRSRMGRLSP
jgi:Trk K+ transport system NAD-binding subunit